MKETPEKICPFTMVRVRLTLLTIGDSTIHLHLHNFNWSLKERENFPKDRNRGIIRERIPRTLHGSLVAFPTGRAREIRADFSTGLGQQKRNGFFNGAGRDGKRYIGFLTAQPGYKDK